MNLTQLFTGKLKKKKSHKNNPKNPEEIAKGPAVPPARSSEAPADGPMLGYSFEDDKTLILPGYQFEVIPILRKLSINNQSVSQALSNIVNLANTGHKVTFDSSVKPEQIDEMRNHLEEVSKNWHYGVAGTHGLVNKLFSQAMITGAVVTETIPNDDFTGVYRVLLPKPETIRFVYDKRKLSYLPYQKVENSLLAALPTIEFGGLIPLNINTFKYIAISGDLESPYPNPPYLPSLGPLEDQKVMLENIKFIIRQIGVVGFLQLMVEKPERKDLESEGQYSARCIAYLEQCKKNITTSMRDGIVVGFQEEHTFEFQSVSKNAGGVGELFDANELLVYSGLKQDASLSGKGGSGAETAITIIFNKLISELKNIQLSVAEAIKFMYDLELRLAGYKFNKLEVVFNPSTVQDDLKMQQAQEIKIRNARQKRMDNIISQDQYADELGYEKPNGQEPVVPYAPQKASTGDPNLDAQKKAVREKSKDHSDKTSRDRKKTKVIQR